MSEKKVVLTYNGVPVELDKWEATTGEAPPDGKVTLLPVDVGIEYRVVWADDWVSKAYSIVDAKKAIEHHAERRLPARIEARYVSKWVEVSDEPD